MIGGNAAARMVSGVARTSRMGGKILSNSKKAYSTTSAIQLPLQTCAASKALLASAKGGYGFLQRGGYGGAARSFSASAVSRHGHLDPPKPGEELYVTFVDKDGDEHTFEVAKGDNLLDIALANDIEMEGACGGSCACSTCHVIVEDEELYNKMPEPDDDENDMLDLAFGLKETSRLGCQVTMTPEMDGLKIRLPTMTRNVQGSDFNKAN